MTTTPELAPSLAEAAQRLRTAITRLHRRLRASSLGGITPAQASTLAMVDRLGAPALRELATAEQVQPPTMTRIIDALERDGLVRRTVDAVDRRSQRVTLTPDGRRELARIRSKKTAYLERQLAGLSARDRTRLADALAVLEQLSEER